MTSVPVIPAYAGIHTLAGFRDKPGMTEHSDMQMSSLYKLLSLFFTLQNYEKPQILLHIVCTVWVYYFSLVLHT